MTSREQFEAEMAKLGDVVDMRRAKNGDMGYMAWDVSLAWRMWQASREAVEVELPSLKQIDSGERYVWSDGVFNFKEDVIESIRAAGIKIIEGEQKNG
uniref:hypothetical protein n=1 Tax=Hafnia alvei TaxID=569 RepID=UPI0024321B09|nr:hypothetical protein [Hafnia alvei]